MNISLPLAETRNRPSGENDIDSIRAVCFLGRIRFCVRTCRSPGRPVQPDELARVAFGPGRKDHVVQGDAALFAAQFEPVGVDQKVRQVKELGDKLLDVGHVELGGRPPGLADRVEQPVGQIEMSALQLEELLGEGLETDQIGADDHDRRVVGAVVVGTRFVVRVVQLFVALAELLEALARLGLHRLG